MAKAETAEEKAAESSESPHPRKKSPLKVLVILVVVLGVLGGGGFVVWSKVVQPRLSAAQGGDKSGTLGAQSDNSLDTTLLGPILPLDPFIVNLAGDDGRRFLKVNMDLELDDSKLKEEIEHRMPQIRDSILVLLSSKTYDDVASVQGKFKLRAEVVNRINAYLQSGKVKKVYFTEFVMQ